jgi:CheY-like chemotaxis protein
MNGDEVLSEIADDIDDIPVIVLSGSHGMRTVQFEDIADEVTASIEKPIDPEEVRSLVQLIDKE